MSHSHTPHVSLQTGVPFTILTHYQISVIPSTEFSLRSSIWWLKGRWGSLHLSQMKQAVTRPCAFLSYPHSLLCGNKSGPGDPALPKGKCPMGQNMLGFYLSTPQWHVLFPPAGHHRSEVVAKKQITGKVSCSACWGISKRQNTWKTSLWYRFLFIKSSESVISYQFQNQNN